MHAVYFDFIHLSSQPPTLLRTTDSLRYSYSLVVDVASSILSLVKADHVQMRSFYLPGPGKPTSSHTLPK